MKEKLSCFGTLTTKLSGERGSHGAPHGRAVEIVVERQFAEVKEAHNLISNLEKGSGAGA